VCANDDENVCDAIVEAAGEGKSFFDLKDAEGLTPLYYAVRSGAVNLANVMLNLGASPRVKDADQIGLVHMAGDVT
jgi:ankyrin repeat protein